MVNTLDELQQQRFFPLPVEFIFKPLSPEAQAKYFYDKYTYYNTTYESMSCCSDVPIAFHYIKPPKMYFIEYLGYQIHPFGVTKNATEKRPRKLKLDEIIRASDVKVHTPNFRDHVDFHNMTSSEMDEWS
jgi:hypothetical protein